MARNAIKAFVWTFLAAFALCGLLGVEAWPLSGFRLFSNVRTDRIAGWQVTTVDANGGERPVDFGDRSWLHIAAQMARLPEQDRTAVCRAWVPGAHGEMRVYRTWTPIGASVPAKRELRARCEL